jgi:hypothetical protein
LKARQHLRRIAGSGKSLTHPDVARCQTKARFNVGRITSKLCFKHVVGPIQHDQSAPLVPQYGQGIAHSGVSASKVILKYSVRRIRRGERFHDPKLFLIALQSSLGIAT